MKDLFPDNQLTNLVEDRLEEIWKTQNSIKMNDLNYSSTKNNNFSNYTLPKVLS